MLSRNIKEYRTKRGLSQQDLAVRLNVVRQTVSKWEKGASIPDAQMLMKLSKELEVSVNTLLDIDSTEKDLKEISVQLETANNELSKIKNKKKKAIRIICTVFLIISALILSFGIINYANNAVTPYPLAVIGSSDGPTAIFVYSENDEIIFYICTAVVLALSIAGLIKTRNKAML